VDPLAVAIGLGFVLGLQHATDGDHLVAVATIVSRERRFTDGALVGAFWGLGHMLTLGTAGAVVVALGVHVPASLQTGLELLVAAMLVALGVLRLRAAARDHDTVPREHLLADHDHDGAEVVHSHAHHHGPSTATRTTTGRPLTRTPTCTPPGACWRRWERDAAA
jgi:high-affinity nickel-transport protein